NNINKTKETMAKTSSACCVNHVPHELSKIGVGDADLLRLRIGLSGSRLSRITRYLLPGCIERVNSAESLLNRRIGFSGTAAGGTGSNPAFIKAFDLRLRM